MTVRGRVREVVGLTVLAEGLPAPVGAIARIQPYGVAPIDAQVVGFRDSRTVLMPLREPRGRPGARRGVVIVMTYQTSMSSRRTSVWPRGCGMGYLTFLMGRTHKAPSRAATPATMKSNV